MKHLFLFSGLGADKRVFQFLDLGEFEIHHVVWIRPLSNESMADYAKRLLPQITAENPILVGVSFGGMIAVEIAKLIDVERVIQISSAQTTAAIPHYLKFFAKLKALQFIPDRVLKKPNRILYWLFGVTGKEDQMLLAAIMKDTDVHFFSWAIQTIPLWNNTAGLKNLIRIHGSNDRILHHGSADYVIDGGGHLMIVTRAKEISVIIKDVLSR